jgi:hypothetical protein
MKRKRHYHIIGIKGKKHIVPRSCITCSAHIHCKAPEYYVEGCRDHTPIAKHCDTCLPDSSCSYSKYCDDCKPEADNKKSPWTALWEWLIKH